MQQRLLLIIMALQGKLVVLAAHFQPLQGVYLALEKRRCYA